MSLLVAPHQLPSPSIHRVPANAGVPTGEAPVATAPAALAARSLTTPRRSDIGRLAVTSGPMAFGTSLELERRAPALRITASSASSASTRAARASSIAAMDTSYVGVTSARTIHRCACEDRRRERADLFGAAGDARRGRAVRSGRVVRIHGVPRWGARADHRCDRTRGRPALRGVVLRRAAAEVVATALSVDHRHT